MGLTNRVEKLEREAGGRVCPCRAPRLIEIVREGAGEARAASPCQLCGELLPVTRIEIVRPPAAEGL